MTAYTTLEQSFSYNNWISLAEVTLTSIHVFNRRRAGEIERVHIEDFRNYERLNKNMNNDIFNSLSAENRKVAKKYVRFCIRGKLGRTVPVLLTNELLQCVNLIIKFRKDAKVPTKNPYIFGLPGFNKDRYRYLRACVLMRKFARECNATYSTSLHGTILRKHVATCCIQLNLNDVDISDLATFMGHTDKIHKEYYRQPLASRDIVKISQYLEAVQGNTQNSSNESSSESELFENIPEQSPTNDNGRNLKALDMSKGSMIHKKQMVNKRTKRSTSPYGATKRTRWTDEEKEAALQAFPRHMENLTLPSLAEIQEMKKIYTSLAHRTSRHKSKRGFIINKSLPTIAQIILYFITFLISSLTWLSFCSFKKYVGNVVFQGISI